MNYPRLLLAAVAVWVAYILVGMVIHEVMLEEIWEALYRDGAVRSDAMARTVASTSYGLALVGSLVFAYIYAKGYEGGSGLQEGMRFGVLVGLLVVAFGVAWAYSTFPVPTEFLIWMSVAEMIEFTVVGMTAGLVYGTATRR